MWGYFASIGASTYPCYPDRGFRVSRPPKIIEADYELVQAHEKLEEVKKAAALAAAKASRVPRVPPCARGAAVLSNTANFSAACGYPVSAVGSTPSGRHTLPDKRP